MLVRRNIPAKIRRIVPHIPLKTPVAKRIINVMAKSVLIILSVIPMFFFIVVNIICL